MGGPSVIAGSLGEGSRGIKVTGGDVIPESEVEVAGFGDERGPQAKEQRQPLEAERQGFSPTALRVPWL